MGEGMSDLFGHIVEAVPFKDIRNQRESVAEEKARLCLELNTILQKAPRALGSASIQKVRAYKLAHKASLKVLQCKTSSRQELESAINTMRTYEEVA